ncbi:MAG: PPC domain-containing DNA-binding protein [Candidatus Saccharimonadales bacterium]
MTYTFDSFNYFVRLQKGERFSDVFTQFAKETECEGAWVNGIGGVQEVELGFYNLETKEYQWKKFDGLREMASMQGNFAFGGDGKLMFHLHGAFGDENYQTVSGHVKDFVAGATVELFVHRSYQPLKRKHDDETGLKVLDV